MYSLVKYWSHFFRIIGSRYYTDDWSATVFWMFRCKNVRPLQTVIQLQIIWMGELLRDAATQRFVFQKNQDMWEFMLTAPKTKGKLFLYLATCMDISYNFCAIIWLGTVIYTLCTVGYDNLFAQRAENGTFGGP